MPDIIIVKNSSYSRYEEMLVRRDNLRKEAFQLDREYVRVFGERILKVFEIKMECIRKKKTISYCQAIANRGGVLDQAELQRYLEKEMTEYQAQLDSMIEDHNAAMKSSTLTQIDLLEIKKIYRRLVKQLHPDINPLTQQHEELRDLWERITIAYRCNNLKAMTELEVLVASSLKAIGAGCTEIDIPDIDQKIAEIEAEMEEIRSTDPYMYKFILESEAAVNEKNAALDEEYSAYVDYEKQLDEILQNLMINGVKISWRMN